MWIYIPILQNFLEIKSSNKIVILEINSARTCFTEELYNRHGQVWMRENF